MIANLHSRIKQHKLLLALVLLGVLLMIGSIAGYNYSKNKSLAKSSTARQTQITAEQKQKNAQQRHEQSSVSATDRAASKPKADSKICSTIQSSLQKSMADNNKQHNQKISDLQRYWKDHGGLSADGYKQAMRAESARFSSVMQQLIKNHKTGAQHDC